MKIELSEEEYAALMILRNTGVNTLEAALVAREALSKGRGRVKRAYKCLALGEQELLRQKRTVTFRRAVDEALHARTDRRKRTLTDFRYISRRLMSRCPGLAERRVRHLSADFCAQCLSQAFSTPQQRRKARAVLSGILSTAVRRGWCSSNPVSGIEAPRVQEKRVSILTEADITRLLTAAAQYKGGNCLAAVGLMLYAGIRPHEVTRLQWQHINLQQQAVIIHPQHSKTGGARRVTIHKPLLNILQQKQQEAHMRICPANWLQHWRQLRRSAGWVGEKKWQQDTLRHTFASYHLQYFRSYTELQYEIGHRDASLLRTRYVDMSGVENAAAFWGEVA